MLLLTILPNPFKLRRSTSDQLPPSHGRSCEPPAKLPQLPPLVAVKIGKVAISFSSVATSPSFSFSVSRSVTSPSLPCGCSEYTSELRPPPAITMVAVLVRVSANFVQVCVLLLYFEVCAFVCLVGNQKNRRHHREVVGSITNLLLSPL